MAASFWPAMKACAAAAGSRVAIFTSLTESPFFLSIHASVKYGAVPGAETETVLPLRSVIFAMVLRTTIPSAPYDLSSWTTWRVATPLAFQTIHVSTVVAAHCTSPEAIARCRSFWGMNLMVTSTPCFLKMPAFSARESGAKPVQPLMATVTLGRSCAGAAAATARARAPATRHVTERMGIPPGRVMGTEMIRPARPAEPSRRPEDTPEPAPGQGLGAHRLRRFGVRPGPRRLRGLRAGGESATAMALISTLQC